MSSNSSHYFQRSKRFLLTVRWHVWIIRQEWIIYCCSKLNLRNSTVTQFSRKAEYLFCKLLKYIISIFFIRLSLILFFKISKCVSTDYTHNIFGNSDEKMTLWKLMRLLWRMRGRYTFFAYFWVGVCTRKYALQAASAFKI